jgi:hypothetical protein
LADWDPLPLGSFKVNFDVAIRPTFAVAAAILRDHSEIFLAVNTLKLPPIDALMDEAHATLLAFRLAVSMGCSPLIIEGESLLTILTLNDHLLFSDWIFTPVIFNSLVQLHSINVWRALKIFRCANLDVHLVAEWVPSHIVFKSILTVSLFISSIRLIKEWKWYFFVIFSFFSIFPYLNREKKKKKKKQPSMMAAAVLYDHDGDNFSVFAKKHFEIFNGLAFFSLG